LGKRRGGGQEHRLRLTQEQLASLMRLLNLLAATRHRSHKNAGGIVDRLEVSLERGPGVTGLHEIYLRKGEASYLDRLSDEYMQDQDFTGMLIEEDYFSPQEVQELSTFKPDIQVVKLTTK